jgi:hypothetical protein
VSGVAAGVTALGVLSGVTHEADAQLVWKTSDWNLAEFEKLVKNPARLKQLYDVTQINDGKFLNNVKNSLNGLRFGFGIPEQQIKVAVAMHGPANMLNYDDYIWEKYQLGAWLKVTDPATSKPAVRNIFYKSTITAQPASANDPNDRNSLLQDTAIETLHARGIQFLSCHTADEELAHALVKHNNLTEDPETIVHEMLAHTVPGVLVVASMVAAVALLQAEGRFTYITP